MPSIPVTTVTSRPDYDGDWTRCPECGAWQKIDVNKVFAYDAVQAGVGCAWCEGLYFVEAPKREVA